MSNDNISSFYIEVNAIANINEPMLVYEGYVNDVAEHALSTLSPVLQDIVVELPVSEVNQLRYEIWEHFGSVFYLENDICLSNISVKVQVDRRYQTLLAKKLDIHYTSEMEQEKADVAKKLRQIYDDDITAIFSEVTVGSMSAYEAFDKSRDSLLKDFDERLRQMREITHYLKGSLNDDYCR